MNFEYTEEQIMIRDAARDFAQRELIHDVIERDTNAIYPTEHIKKLAELGFLGMLVDPKYDGGGMDTISFVLAMEEISKIDSSVSVSSSLLRWAFNTHGEKYEHICNFHLQIAAGQISGSHKNSESSKN